MLKQREYEKHLEMERKIDQLTKKIEGNQPIHNEATWGKQPDGTFVINADKVVFNKVDGNKNKVSTDIDSSVTESIDIDSSITKPTKKKDKFSVKKYWRYFSPIIGAILVYFGIKNT